MKKTIFLLISILFGCLSCANDVEKNAERLIARMIPGQENNIRIELKEGSKDFFELETVHNKLVIRGNNGVSLARGLNHYMRNYLHSTVSWTGNNIQVPAELPAIREKLRIEAALPLRNYLNYCTYSYSMAYWSWEQWEKEIDRMALQGINMPLAAVLGQHAVWQNTLRRLGYSEEEIFDFLPGPGYEAWWLMGNLEKFGGPVSQNFIDKQAGLQKKILKRMREYGMEPVFQGFYGMVPNSLIQKYPQAQIKDVGKWITYQRPAFLVPTDSLFNAVAEIYYDEQKKLFGEAKYFGGDPFHEGGNSKGIDISAAASAIQQAMKKVNPDAVWVIQGWGHNPSTALLKGIKPKEAVILDLMACARPQWGGVPTSVSHKKDGYFEHDWIWCALPDFGGRIGMYGKLDSYATGSVKARIHPMGKHISGIGTIPEGIGTNPIDYDIMYDMAWCQDTINVSDWLKNYVHYRYGEKNDNAIAAWQRLGKTVFNCPTQYDGPQESFLCARPSLKINKVSSWGTAELYYDPQELVLALQDLYQVKDKFKNSDTYRYDLVDLTRQVLADYSKNIHADILQAFEKRDMQALKNYCNKFLELIQEQAFIYTDRIFGRQMDC